MDSDFHQNIITRSHVIFWLLSMSLGYNYYFTILRLFRPIGLQYSREITGQRSLCGQNQFELYKRGLGMASSIKSQHDPNDLEDFALTKAEKVCHLRSVGNDKIRPRSE